MLDVDDDHALARRRRARTEGQQASVGQHHAGLEVHLRGLVAATLTEVTPTTRVGRQHQRFDRAAAFVEQRQRVHVVLHDHQPSAPAPQRAARPHVPRQIARIVGEREAQRSRRSQTRDPVVTDVRDGGHRLGAARLAW
ncbi:MAG: hypothetical protein U0168_27320 [Nannocystaceae bacterium]